MSARVSGPRSPRGSRAPKKERTDLLAKHLLECERRFLATELFKHHGNVSETAEALGLSRRGLERRMAVHDELRALASRLRGHAGIKGPR